MLRAFPIGRFFGIRLDVHTSWLPIYALVTLTIANAGPIGALGRAQAYAVGAVAALVLFASVVVHEFAHALTARRFDPFDRAVSVRRRCDARSRAADAAGRCRGRAGRPRRQCRDRRARLRRAAFGRCAGPGALG
jgi:hypothetical protein